MWHFALWCFWALSTPIPLEGALAELMGVGVGAREGRRENERKEGKLVACLIFVENHLLVLVDRK